MVKESANNADVCSVETSKLAAKCTERICEQGFIDCDKLKSVEAVDSIYHESSCLVWRLCLKEGHPDRSHCYILKMAETSQSSPFWQMMDSLFEVSIADNMLDGGFIYDFVRRMVPISVPEYVRSSDMDEIVCLLMTYIDGSTQEFGEITDDNVKVLAEYLAETHRNAVKGFGSLKSVLHGEGGFSPKDWQKRLFITLETLAHKDEKVAAKVAEFIEQKSHIKVQRFVPIMMDLRWDQFVYKENKLNGVYDLDAYVSAPVELDFVMLEYLLTEEQSTLFKKAYKESKGHIPKIGKVRELYRTFFFLVDMLGQTDYDKWMAQPTFFK